MMFLTSSILLGFIRLCFIVLFLFYLNRKFINISHQVNFLDFIVINWFRYTSLLLAVIFTLVELNAYNLFNCFFIIVFLIGIDSIGLEHLKNPRQYFHSNIKATLLNFLRNVENKKSFWFWFSFKSSKNRKKNTSNRLILAVTIIIGVVTFVSRYYFIIYDNYSLSDSWIYDLNKAIEFDNQFWFNFDLAPAGEFALINFYGKITDVSAEIALQVISLLESTLLAMIIFWIINKLTPSKFLAPIIASFSFALVYVLTPLNVYFLFKANPIFMALTFALPAFGFYLKPDLLKINRISYFVSFILCFIAIGMIDFFTFCILIPPFLILGLMIINYKYKKTNFVVLLAFGVAFAILFGIYYFACRSQQADLLEYFHNNLLSVSSYTYVPQLIFPYAEIIKYAQFSTFIGFFLVLLLGIIKKENWRATIIFFLYFNFLIVLTYIKSQWIDIDMLNNSLSIFLPIILGLNAAIVIRILNFIFGRYERFNIITMAVLIVALIYASIFYQEKNINSLIVSDEIPKQILDAYDKIEQTYFPYSYTVVNDPAAQVISTNKHFFMNYDFFMTEYPNIDAINTKHKKDPLFLIKNPEYSISKSVLVFVLNDKSKDESNIFSLNKHLKSTLINEMKLLHKRGRSINLFYKSKILNVYEIVNEPRESKISDLIF